MKLKIFIVALVAMLSSCAFVSCSDEQNDFNSVENAIVKKNSNSLMSLFYKDEFLDIMGDEESFGDYIELVSNEFRIDIQALASSDAILALDSLAMDECFLGMIENDSVPQSTTSRLEEIEQSLQTTDAEKDSAMICSLIVESYNLMHCKAISMSEYENMYNNRRLDLFIAERALERLQNEYPVLKDYDEEELTFVLTLASLYRHCNDMDSKAAPIPCKQRCKNAKDRAVRNAYVVYVTSMAGCLFSTNPVVAAGCAAIHSINLYSTMDNIMQTYNDCVAGCK